jgi:hypothetical protein
MIPMKKLRLNRPKAPFQIAIVGLEYVLIHVPEARGWLRATIPSVVASIFRIWYVGIPRGAEHCLQGHRGLVMMLRTRTIR